MGLRRSLMVLGLLALSSGCNLAENFVRDTAFEVGRATDDCFERIRDRRLANTAWDEAQKSAAMETYSADYARGFKDGYADYLFAGGNGEPPSLPCCYWGVRYETPQGYQAIEDWMSGYRHGAVAAQQSGLRELVIFPVAYSDPDMTSYHPYPVPPGSPPRFPSELHPPREVTPNSADQAAPKWRPAGLGKPWGTESVEKPK